MFKSDLFTSVFSCILITIAGSQDGTYFSREAIFSGANIQVRHDKSINRDTQFKNLNHSPGKLMKFQALNSKQFKKIDDVLKNNRRQEFESSNAFEGNLIKEFL
jgi:hypothetical protein